MRNGGDGTEIESCKDCANFEDRRDIEGVALCATDHGEADRRDQDAQNGGQKSLER